MKHAYKCESIHEKLAIMEYLKNNNIAFQETAWKCREKDFQKYNFVYFDDYHRNIGSTDNDEDLELVSLASLFKVAITTPRGLDLNVM
ncbi:MAG: hypothetical protein DRJ10_01355 [Bacteroidetes bacterium]|nr:MAG: hypothetical protein DRJ10_01355 [Bacteroidota bacterium]